MTELTMPHGEMLVANAAIKWVEDLLTKINSPEFAADFQQKILLMDEADGDDFWIEGFSLRPYNVKNGVLTIPVKGILMAGLPYALGSYATGYAYITQAIKRGVADNTVTRIVLDVNSPGGTVPGCFDCADALYDARGAKPIDAYANEAAYSAAFAIASSADTVTVARTGGVGSIGVITAHRDISGALAQNGVKITEVFAGDHKADGSPNAPLSEQALKQMKGRIDALHGIFVATVARNRGMDEQAVRDTQAATFMAQEAVENGLADYAGPLDTTSATADNTTQSEDEDMTLPKTEAELADAIAAAVATATADATAEAATAATAAAQTRVTAIMDSDEAKTRPVAARQVALHSDMTVEAAATFLSGLNEEAKAGADEEAAVAAAAEAAASANGTAFAGAMDANNPNLGAGGDGDDGGGGDEEAAFVASYRTMRGR